jgi:hypothetical protein
MFCEVERSYIEDGFNLYGLRACVSNFSDCLDLILDRIGPDDSDDSHLTQSACTLYGLIHARYIITAHGLDAMYNKVRSYCVLPTLWIRSCVDIISLTLHRLFLVCCEGVWNLSFSPVRRPTSLTSWSKGRNGSRHGENILPQMSMCLPPTTSSIT